MPPRVTGPQPADAAPAEEALATLTFVGTAGSTPTAARSGPALLVEAADGSVLVDCGEGTARQLLVAGVDAQRLDACVFTHLHADHFLGLGGLLALLDEAGRERPLLLVGPRGLARVVRAFERTRRCRFRLDLLSVAPPQVFAAGPFQVLGVPVEHPGSSLGFAIGIEGRKLVVSGDTAPCHAVERIAAHSDLLVHEAPFCYDEAERARESGHSTARQAGALARRAAAKALALVHLSSRHPAARALDEAREAFPEALLPRDLDRVVLGESSVRFARRRERAPNASPLTATPAADL